MPLRYSLFTPATQLKERFDVETTNAYQPHYNISPTQLVPVISNASPHGFSYFYWGITPKWSKNKSISTKWIQIEAEQIREKQTMKNALVSRRCLVPADGYYEWKSVGKKGKVPYRVLLKSEEPFTFAGIWEEYEEDGQFIHTFKIITIDAIGSLQEINSRMPVILPSNYERNWLNDTESLEMLLDLLKPYQSEAMSYYTISPLVNSIKQDSPQIIQPSQAVDQFGNYTLFN
ncbi:MAG: SOS response-associated peptidase [Bacteroidetes bacterium]|nr:SOS response-associated peptidase [Bacteroidota bacterium]